MLAGWEKIRIFPLLKGKYQKYKVVVVKYLQDDSPLHNFQIIISSWQQWEIVGKMGTTRENIGSVSGITACKTQNKEGKEGNEKEHFFSENPNPIIRAGREGTILFANEAAFPLLESWGMEKGKKLPLKVINIIAAVFEKKERAELEFQGEEKSYSITFQPVFEEDAVDLYGFDISGQKRLKIEEDEKHALMESLLKRLTREISLKNEKLRKEISERKQIEKALRNHLQFMKIMMDTIPAPVFYKNGDGKYLGCNKLFENIITGLEEKAIIGKSFSELKTQIPFPVSRGHQLLDMDLLKKGGKHIYETELLCADGQNRNFLATRAVFKEETGESSLLAGVLLDISEHKHVEKVLRENLHFQESFLDAIPIPVFYKNMEGIYLSCNEMFARELLGLPKEQVIGKTMWELRAVIPEEFAQIYEEFDQKVRGGEGNGKPLHFEAKAKCARKGEIRDFLYTKALYSDIDGEAIGIVSVMQDISERKRAEKVLQDSEERYRLVAEQTGQLIYDHDMLSGTNDWAGAIERLTGYTIEEYLKFNIGQWSGHIHPEDRKTAVCAHFHGDAVYHEEYRLRKKDGSYFYAEDTGKYLRDEKGKIYRLIGVIKDITEQKLARKELEKSEERFRSFMNNFKGIAFQGNLDFTTIFMHGDVKGITGYEAEDFTSGKLHWKKLIFSEDLPKVKEISEKLESDPKALIEREYRIKHRNGKFRWVHELMQNICNSSGKPVFVQGSIYDITERKEAEEILNKIQGVRKREIHHRIKNNLQVISSLLELQAEKFKDEEVLEAFRESQNRVISMSLIHESLHGSRDVETLDFSAYLRKLTDELLTSYTSGREKISLQLEVEEVYFGMDLAIPLGIIINELVSNSLKHAFPEGKGHIHIKLCRQKSQKGENPVSKIEETEKTEVDKNKSDDSLFTLIVSDNGIGFPEEFDFRHMDSLGLQLVNTLVEQIEGIIELKRNKGTIFKLNFKDVIS